MKHNEKGMTLVELLAALTLLSIVSILIWTTFSISVKYNRNEASKLQLQQEANRIITEIQQTHRQCHRYTIHVKADEIRLSNCFVQDGGWVDQGVNRVIASTQQYILSGDFEGYQSHEVQANGVHASYELRLDVIDPTNNRIRVQISSEISRYY